MRNRLCEFNCVYNVRQTVTDITGRNLRFDFLDIVAFICIGNRKGLDLCTLLKHTKTDVGTATLVYFRYFHT